MIFRNPFGSSPFGSSCRFCSKSSIRLTNGLDRSGSLGWPSGLNFPDLFSPLEYKNSRSFRSTLLATLPFSNLSVSLFLSNFNFKNSRSFRSTLLDTPSFPLLVSRTVDHSGPLFLILPFSSLGFKNSRSFRSTLLVTPSSFLNL